MAIPFLPEAYCIFVSQISESNEQRTQINKQKKEENNREKGIRRDGEMCFIALDSLTQTSSE